MRSSPNRVLLALLLLLSPAAFADLTEVPPLPGREKVTPERPTWCPAGAKPKAATENEVEADLDDLSNRFSNVPDQLMGRAGALACKYPDSPHAQKRVAAWRQRWINDLALTRAEDRVILKNLLLADDDATAGWCKSVAPSMPEDSVSAARLRFVRDAFCLGSNPNPVLLRAGKGSLKMAYYLDRPTQPVSELVRAIHVFNCFGFNTDAVGYCGTDADAVNPAKAQAELDALKAPAGVKAMFGMMVSVARMKVAGLREVAATESNANRKLVLEAGAKGMAAARAEYAAHKAEYDALYALEDKVFAIPWVDRRDSDAKVGCAAVRALFQKAVLDAKPKTRDDIWNVTGGTSLGYAAASRFAMCASAEGDIPTAVVAYQLAKIRRKAFAGERFAAVRAMEEESIKQAEKGQRLSDRAFELMSDAALDSAFVKIDDRTRYLQVGRIDYSPPGPGYNIGSDPYKESGVVKAVTKTATGFHVTFKSEKYEVPEYKCVNQGLSSYEPDGTPIYFRSCTYVRSTWETWTPRERDLTVYASDSVKPGQYALVFYVPLSDDRAPKQDIVFEVYSGAPKKGKDGKLVSYFGIALPGGK